MGTMGCDVDSDSARYSAEALVTGMCVFCLWAADRQQSEAWGGMSRMKLASQGYSILDSSPNQNTTGQVVELLKCWNLCLLVKWRLLSQYTTGGFRQFECLDWDQELWDWLSDLQVLWFTTWGMSPRTLLVSFCYVEILSFTCNLISKKLIETCKL